MFNRRRFPHWTTDFEIFASVIQGEIQRVGRRVVMSSKFVLPVGHVTNDEIEDRFGWLNENDEENREEEDDERSTYIAEITREHFLLDRLNDVAQNE